MFRKLGKSLGTFWDTHIGREGLLGAGGELLGLGPSGTTRDIQRREKRRLGTYKAGIEDRAGPMKEYYGALGALQDKESGIRKQQMDYGASVEGETITKGYGEQMGQMGFAGHAGQEGEMDKALTASAFKYGSERGALDIEASATKMRTGKAFRGEYQGLTDMIWQLNEQYKAT